MRRTVKIKILSESDYTEPHTRYYNHSNDDGGDWSYETCEVYVPGVGWRKEPYILDDWKVDHTSWTLKNGSVLLLGSYFDPYLSELVTPGVGTAPGFNLNNPIRLTAIIIQMEYG